MHKELSIIILFLIIWNLGSFLLMGIDKYKATRGKWRISEKTLLLYAFAMGSVGSIAGALIFHHKTKKLKFRILLPAALLINILIILGIDSIPFSNIFFF